MDIYDLNDIPDHLKEYFEPVPQMGLEKTPEEYIEKLVEVLREVRRVLRNDGTLWLNLGDRFSPQSSHKGGTQYDNLKGESNWGERSRATDSIPRFGKAHCLMGIPWGVAFALVEDGWILRRDIIWAKSVSFCPTYVGSCMPEPVKNRPISSHEYVFMLTKSNTNTYWSHQNNKTGARTPPPPDYMWEDRLTGEKVLTIPENNKTEKIQIDGKLKPRWRRFNLWTGYDYFYDTYAVRESPSQSSMDRITQNTFWEQEGGEKDYFAGTSVSRSSRRALENFAMNPGRNLRSVWTINPYPTKDVHFATFPPNLIKPMILASTSEYGCCAECGAPYIRIVEKGEPDEEWKKQCGADSQGEYEGESKKWLKQDALGKNTYTGFNKRWKASQIQKLQNASNVKRNVLKGMVKKTTIGWAKTCSCKTNEIEKPLVLDIFAGSGTIGIAAGLTGRDFVGIEINPSYIKLAEERIPREITKIRKKEEKERKLAEKEEKIMETLTEDEIKLLKKIKLKLKHPNFKDTDTFNQTVLFSD